jgi:Abortive infection C-terminus
VTERLADELIPRSVRQVLIDTVGGDGLYVVRQITELFELEDFSKAPLPDPQSTGARRQEAEAFQAGIDFTSVEQSERYLRVVAQVLSDHAGDEDWKRMKRDRLRGALRRSGIKPDADGNLQLPPSRALGSLSLAGVPSESDIRLHIRRLERLEQEPEEMVGAAKDLVEATLKYAARALDGEVPGAEKLPALSARVMKALKLHPAAIAPTKRGAEVMVSVLGGLGKVAPGLAELRNMGYGVGHGRGERISGIKRRHAELAARSAITFSAFVLDTLDDPDAPWRDELAENRQEPGAG